MEQKYCDYCGKEINSRAFRIWNHWSMIIPTSYDSQDFCSKNCFLKYIDEKIR